MDIISKKRIKRFEHEVELLVLSLRSTTNKFEMKFYDGSWKQTDEDTYTDLHDTLDSMTADIKKLAEALDKL
jgi:hypothetical protein